MTVRLRTIGVILAILAIGVAAFVYFGMYNIAASTEHLPLTYRFLHSAMRQSVKAHADEVAVPELESDGRIRTGAVLYRAHCVQCHGAPGIPPDAVAIGMTPPPANLVAAGRDWKPNQLYWVIRHGIKMTAMPAWGLKLTDDEMWSLVALILKMPHYSPQQFKQLDREGNPSILNAQDGGAGENHRPGDPAAGRRAVTQYLCATCHRIPGVAGAYYDVGPPLGGIANRSLIGGVLPNTRENMVRWLRNPQAIDPQSAMPDLRLSEQEARDISAFLYTLDERP